MENVGRTTITISPEKLIEILEHETGENLKAVLISDNTPLEKLTLVVNRRDRK